VGANQFAITNSSGLLRSGHNFRVVTQIDRVETNLDQLTARLMAQVTQPNQKYD
jgi:hypothetical protein